MRPSPPSFAPLHRPRFRAVAACAAVLLLAATACGAQDAASSTSESTTVVLDRVVAVVNSQAILQSDLDDEIRLAVLDPGEAGLSGLTPQRALEHLIGRTLIQQQIRQEEARTAEPSQDEVKARLQDLRTQLPACVRQNCATETGWTKFLAAHGLTEQRVETYLRHRLQILGFIEMRFRQGIRIAPEEIETYYRETLLPLYAADDQKPSLDSVSPRIQEILLQRQVNVLFDDWLKNLRKQGDVEVLDPAFETQERQETGKSENGGEAGK